MAGGPPYHALRCRSSVGTISHPSTAGELPVRGPDGWPSKLHDGFFNKEICLFKVDGVVTVSKIVSGGKSSRRIKSGGTNKDIPGDTWNRLSYVFTKNEFDECMKFWGDIDDAIKNL